MNIKTASLSVGIASILATGITEASHFRGGTLIPTIRNNVLTVQSTTYWRPTFVGTASVSSTIGALSQTSNTLDTSDSRYTIRRQTFTRSLNGVTAGNIDLSFSSCCRVRGIHNWDGVGSSSVSWRLDSRIVWDGSSDNSPILFDFSSIQPEVLRGSNYSDSLGATSGSGLTLSYTGALNGIPSQAPGLNIDPNTGQLTIAAADTAGYADNTSGNVGADYAFSGTIEASDGSRVEFDWLFDGVGALSNLAPNVNDVVINALVGSTINETVVGSDPNGDPLTWDILSFFGPGGASLSDVTFNPATQLFTFDSTGFGPGTYIASIRASDGSSTDTGTLTINLSNPIPGGGNNVPEPSSLLLMTFAALGFRFTRKKNAQ